MGEQRYPSFDLMDTLSKLPLALLKGRKQRKRERAGRVAGTVFPIYAKVGESKRRRTPLEAEVDIDPTTLLERKLVRGEKSETSPEIIGRNRRQVTKGGEAGSSPNFPKKPMKSVKGSKPVISRKPVGNKLESGSEVLKKPIKNGHDSKTAAQSRKPVRGNLESGSGALEKIKLYSRLVDPMISEKPVHLGRRFGRNKLKNTKEIKETLPVPRGKTTQSNPLVPNSQIKSTKEATQNKPPLNRRQSIKNRAILTKKRSF